jgi:hypothetical protein
MNNKSSSNRYTDGAEIGTVRSQAGDEKLVVVERGLPRAPSVCIRTLLPQMNTITRSIPAQKDAQESLLLLMVMGTRFKCSPSFSRPRVSVPLSLSLATTSSGRVLRLLACSFFSEEKTLMVTGVYCRACPDLQTWGNEASFTHAFTMCRNSPQQFSSRPATHRTRPHGAAPRRIASSIALSDGDEVALDLRLIKGAEATIVLLVGNTHLDVRVLEVGGQDRLQHGYGHLHRLVIRE